ncbi:amidase [Rhodobium gokarnense]|uniref:Aspartyl-tRNA(Asn)/glutamyl-tRNA(Gln) amidotransferase subunit A n=1 Tax=Rhodobium gokarnense TaxID=364296 RepID=A0ABT3HEQ2_9HYPH|nr:amidase [Rhodobium gokarnense]MCW2308886.1 aspartyl-tRNA(Asn)/glutamyl-tRNA(Gln) amidotransferase subunit A [Rhodobium gokarnense]
MDRPADGVDIANLSATDLGRLFKAGSLTPADAVTASFERIDAFDAAVNAFVAHDREAALSAAGASQERWRAGTPLSPIDGVPVTIKDIVLIKGHATTYGSRVLDMAEAATEDSPCVARLKEAGAIVIGITQTPEIGWKALTDSPRNGITRNPWDLSKTPAGSSGGAAVAAALGMGALHVGTDGGGSIRVPAAFTGIAGIKPSFGRVPAYPQSAFGTVAHVGPMARTVDDLAIMLKILSRPDGRDWYSRIDRDFDPCAGLNDGVRGLRIAYSPDLGYVNVDPEIAAAVAAAVAEFGRMGATVETVDPGFACPLDTFHKHWFAGALNRCRDVSGDALKELDPGLAEIIEEARGYSLLDYMTAVDARAVLGRTMRQFLDTYDLLITPSVPIRPFTAGLEVPEGSGCKRWTEWAAFSYPFNLTQQPACSIPCGFTSDGLPIGLQIVGPMEGDALVLRAAKAYEEKFPFKMPSHPKGQ